MSQETVLLIAVVFFAILTQAVSGSGLALIAMPLLIQLMAPLTAATLVSMMALTTQMIMLTRYRSNLHVRGLWQVMLGSVCGIPIGILALAQLDQRVILTALGVLLVSYSAYSLFFATVPEIKTQRWDFGVGFVSGLLGGAYNTGGPPYVIYGVGRRWAPAEFKANLQILLMVNSVIVGIAHLMAGHYTPEVLQDYVIALPVILVAAGTGFWLDQYIDVGMFRKIVLVLLLLIGIRMLIP